MVFKPHVTVYGSPMSAQGNDSPGESAPGTRSTAASYRNPSGPARGSGNPNPGRGNPLNAPAFKLNTSQAPTGEYRAKEKSTFKDRDDPFVTQSNVEYLTTGKAVFKKSMAEQKLSPTASSFTPVANDSFADYCGRKRSSNPPKVAPLDPHPHGTGFINATSTPESARGMFAQSQRAPLRAGLSNGIYYGDTPPSSSSYHGLPSRTRFTPGTPEYARTYLDPKVTRAIAVTNFDEDAVQILDTVLQCAFPGALNKKFHFGGPTPMICLGFFEKLDAQNMLEHIGLYFPRWSARYMTSVEFAQKVGDPYGDGLLDDGEVLIEARYTSSDARGIDLAVVQEYVVDLLKNNGDICALNKIDGPKTSAASFHAEFYDCRDARKAAFGMNGYTVMNCVFTVGLNEFFDIRRFEDPFRSNDQRIHDQGKVAPWDLNHGIQGMNLRTPPSANRSFSDHQDPYNYRGNPRSMIYGSTPTSPPYDNDYGQDYTPSPYHGDGHHHSKRPWDLPGAIGQERDQFFYPPKHYAQLSPQRQTYLSRFAPPPREYHEFNNYNYVDVPKILRGEDVRTTIMLRNIPNKVQLPMLEDMVNECSFGKYNFMYLRIDFANNCNVGYAFINFEDPYSIIEFVRHRAGRKWEVYSSEKVPEVSYATIQGQDCLIQKFRNSSVMRENPLYRPKIFHTGNHPQAGLEAPFPGPDNQSKLKRSMENAETIGLFPPRSSHKHRNDQRRNRSQFDRGTPFAVMEEARFDRMEYEQRRNVPSNGYRYFPSGPSPKSKDYHNFGGNDHSNGSPKDKYPRY